MAKSTSRAHIIITADGKAAQNVITVLNNESKKLKEQIQQAVQQQRHLSDPKGFKELQAQYRSVRSAVNQNKNAYIDLNQVVKNLSGTTLHNLQRSLKECKRQMKNPPPDVLKINKWVSKSKALNNKTAKKTEK